MQRIALFVYVCRAVHLKFVRNFLVIVIPPMPIFRCLMLKVERTYTTIKSRFVEMNYGKMFCCVGQEIKRLRAGGTQTFTIVSSFMCLAFTLADKSFFAKSAFVGLRHSLFEIPSNSPNIRWRFTIKVTKIGRIAALYYTQSSSLTL